MPIQDHRYAPRPKTSHVEVYWKTVTYRTVAMYLVLILSVVMAILYLIYPEAYSGADHADFQGAGRRRECQRRTDRQASKVRESGRPRASEESELRAMGHGGLPHGARQGRSDPDQRRRRGAHHLCRRHDVHGTDRHVVTVEENSVGRDSETRVGMHITSGAVDLATGTWDSPKSKAEVSFSNAVASVQAEQPRRRAQRSEDERSGNHRVRRSRRTRRPPTAASTSKSAGGNA